MRACRRQRRQAVLPATDRSTGAFLPLPPERSLRDRTTWATRTIRIATPMQKY
jgi:hypothetical protein